MPYFFDRTEDRIRSVEDRDYASGEICRNCRRFVNVRPYMERITAGECLMDEQEVLSTQTCLDFKEK